MIVSFFQKTLSFCIYCLWLLISVALILWVLEFACRLFLPEWTSPFQERAKSWQYDDVLGWSGIPNTKVQISHPEFNITVSTNSHGLRDREYSYQRNHKKRMLVLGDSFTWGYGVEDDERFTDVLENSLNNWEIINAGVSGYGTDQELLYYTSEGYKYNADIVVLLFFYNDYENNFSSEQYRYNKPQFLFTDKAKLILKNSPVPPSTLQQRFTRYIEHDTFLLVRVKRFYNQVESLIATRFFGRHYGTLGFSKNLKS